MSIYTATGDKNIMNIGKQTTAFDVSTRNPYFATIVGYEAGTTSVGLYNTIFGYKAGKKVKKSGKNVLIGANAGLNMNSENNVLIGVNAGINLVDGIQNVCIGNNVVENINGNNNICIGYNNTSLETTGVLTNTDSSNNICIGNLSGSLGYFNSVIGECNFNISQGTLIHGNNILDRSSNSFLFGKNIHNYANDTFIINTNHENTTPLINNIERYFNIQDKLISYSSDSNSPTVLIVQDTELKLKSMDSQISLTDKVSFNTANGSVQFGDIINIEGKYTKLTLDEFIFLGQKSCNAYFNLDNEISLISQYGTINIQSNNINLSNDKSSAIFEECILFQASNSIAEICPNMISINQYSNSSIILNDNLIMKNKKGNIDILENGFITLYNSNIIVSLQSNTLSFENKNNSILTMKEDITLCNNISSLYLSSESNSLQYSSNTSILLHESTMCNNANIIVNNSKTYCNSNISILEHIQFCYKNHLDSHWDMYLENIYGTSNASDLVFRSKNGTYVCWTDDFQPEILNFTGKHRCTPHQSSDLFLDKYIGCIVKSTGKYNNLKNKKNIDIDEAIPIVELVSEEYDPCVFGVLCGFENNDIREYRLGNMIFRTYLNTSKDINIETKRVIINAVGEGAIWVTNANGNFKNGDLITSSSIMGYGMRQKSSFVRNYTVGKITCDCSFDVLSMVYKCEEFTFNGRIYKKALVGCIYRF